jgi:CBS domain-containing protein
MPEHVAEVMTHDPDTVDVSATLAEVARIMRDEDVGAVLVTETGRLRCLVTDRDIVVRAIADGRDPGATRVADVCTDALVTLNPQDTVETAIRRMREHDVRRLPVVQGDRPVGIVSLGDLAVDRDPDSALADISAASPDT